MSWFKKVFLLAGDVAALYLSLGIALLVRYGSDEALASFSVHVGPFSAIFVLWLLVLYLADLYRPATLRSNTAIATSLAIAIAIAGSLSMIALYLFGDFFVLTPKTNLLILGVVFFVIGTAWRAVTRTRFAAGAENIVLLGDSPQAAELVAYLAENPHTGYRVTTWVREEASDLYVKLTDAVRAAGATAVVVPNSITKNSGILSTVYRLLPLEISIIQLSDFYELIFERTPLDALDESWFIQNISTRHSFYDPAKRLIDIAVACITLVIFSPFFLVIAAAVALSSPGPIIFRQERIGKNGTPFTLVKFRVMVTGHNGSPVTMQNDPRFTRIGRLLNFTHLNELPQLWNVLKGDISVTGPRPESVPLVATYRTLPYYDLRHAVKPGLTGWAQINFRPSVSLEEAYEKLKYDIYYIKNRSVFLDTLIIIRTIRYFFSSH
jgi:exopolysaccharide biosynthesis polyprenyl glycosylphosphotransferase